MSNLSSITTVKEILGRHDFHFGRALGQNSLINPTVCPCMMGQSGATPGTGVLGVGPGIGVFTCELVERVQKAVSIELDCRLLPVLEETLVDCDNITVVDGGILKFDLRKPLQREFAGTSVSVCANLPYYIISPVIMRSLKERLNITSLAAMVQKEAARCICVQPDIRGYGAVTVAMHYYVEPETLLEVSHGSLLSVPNVDSSVIRLILRKESVVRVKNETGFFSLVRTTFGQRGRAMLNSVSVGLSLLREAVGKAPDNAGSDHRVRVEQLTTQESTRLYICLALQKG